MKLVSYTRDGRTRHGYVADEAAGTVAELGDGDLAAAVAAGAGTDAGWRPGEPSATHRLADLAVRAPIARPTKVLAVAANYQDHVAEGGGEPLDKSTLAPRLFLKPGTSVTDPGADIALPSVSTQVDWEAELVVVVGRGGRDIPVEKALDHVAGYAVGNDVSARSVDYGYERDTSSAAVGYFDWLAGKWPDGFAPYGPYLVTADEVPDPQGLDIELEVNGTLRQQGSTAEMIFTVAELVAFASRLMTLEPTDIIMTGTPAGVGAASGTYLASGDRMTVRIAGLGTLTNRVV
ncbi:fumarylacetoacetate hydrolase family protein [Jiangella rhizosphaerae]|uniref:FAA hydrolase family protein n=1 Tax=Jiangella rhizosphaerae TaxID=2293569 RepID=A0A418KYB7_9ACTN|nr:fumarylacetoacetate hydrolase family protein [Jiangella rhizosphaerae]RIQ37368.1 FAA hydrolase family protein [Jiangella rhizosphaerae]